MLIKAKEGEHPFGDIGQVIALGVFLIVWAGDSFLLHRSTVLSALVPLYLRLGVLALVLVVATYLYKSGHGVVPHEGRTQAVVTSGAFRFVRHPLYTASLLTYLGLVVSTASLASLVLFVGIIIFYDYIAGYEEKLLLAKFPDEYGEYRRRTGKWVPGIGKGR
jgi:protein-S-isoprenylcysteine O-methyltransferase Ste14